MIALFDHNVDRRLRGLLPGHEISTTRERGWERLSNGKLLAAAAAAGFEVFISVDKKLRHEQNLSKLPLPVVVLDAVSNALATIREFVPHLQTLLANPLPNALHVVHLDGRIEVVR